MRKRYLVGGGILGIAIGFLIFTSMGSSVSYYLTVNELLDKDNGLYDTNIRVIGQIVGESIAWNAEGLELKFDIAEDGTTLPVIYHGARPSGFKDGANLLVEGEYRSGGTFHASVLIMKCPSKYEPVE